MTEYFGLIIVGVFTGIGNAVGSYIANRHAIKHMDSLTEKIGKLTDVMKK